MNTDINENITQRSERTLRLYKLVSIAFALASTLLCSLCYAFEFDTTLLFFNSVPLVFVFYVTVALSILFSLSAFFIFPKALTDSSFPDKPSFFPIALAPALAFLGYAIFSAYSMTASPIFDRSHLINAIISLLCAASYVAACFPSKFPATARSLLGLSPMIWGISVISDSYFDHSIAVNSPIKTLFHFSVAAIMIYSLLEARLILEKRRPRLFLAISSVALMLCATCGISSLILAIASDIRFTLGYALSHAVILTASLYILVRIFTFSPKLPKADGSADPLAKAETTEASASSEETAPETESPCETEDGDFNTAK